MQNFLITTPNIPGRDVIPDDSRFGIDRVSFYYRLNSKHSLPIGADWTRKTDGKLGEPEKEYFVLKHPFGNQLADVFVAPEHELCKVSFNAPKALEKTNQNPLPPNALGPLISSLIGQLQVDILPCFAKVTDDGEILWEIDWETNLGITSLEIARDFLIPAHKESELQSAIDGVSARRNYTEGNFKSRGSGYTSSQSTKKSGKDRFYNKDAELAKSQPCVSNDATKVRYRFESELRAPRLKKFGLNTLAGLNDSTCWAALCERFTETGWNVTISSQDSLLSQLESLDSKTREKILGYNSIACLGLSSNLSAGLGRERKKLARQLGLIVGTDVKEHPSGSSVLSLNAGTLVEIDEDDN